MTAKTIHTNRFVLSKLTFQDAEKYYRLSNNDNVMKYVTGYGLSREESDEMLKVIVAEHKEDSFLGRYLVEDQLSGDVVGVARLDGVGQEVEIGYRIAEEHWGKGAATEIATALIRFALRHLRADRVIAYVNVENHASIRVLEKTGMYLAERIEDIDEIKYLFIYPPQTKSFMKKALYIFLGILAIILIAALVMPKDYAVEKEVVINKPRDEVFAYLKLLKNQNQWSVWSKRDPNMKTSFEGTDGTVGFISKWEGNDDVGTGEQEILRIEEGSRIDTDLRFIKPFESNNDAYMITEAIDSASTRVKWGFSGQMPVPMNVMLPFMGMDKTVGKDFQTGLNNLKDILEK